MITETIYREIGIDAREPYREPTVLMSPFIGMDEPWSQEKINELDAALDPYESDPEPETH